MRQPPNPEMRLLMFEALALEYEEFDDMLPSSNDFNIGGKRDPEVHRGNLVRAMLLRKFILEKENLFLPKVYDAIAACSIEEKRAQTQENVAVRKQTFEDARTSRSSFVLGSGEDQTAHGEHDIFFDLEYGRLLHADFDKWSRLERMPDLYPEWGLWSAYQNFDFLVKEARITVTEGRSKGWLNVPERSRPVQFPTDGD